MPSRVPAFFAKCEGNLNSLNEKLLLQKKKTKYPKYPFQKNIEFIFKGIAKILFIYYPNGKSK